MRLVFEARNLRGLRHFRWEPEGVCALVGPNGSGKSTVLQLLSFFGAAVQQGVVHAAASVFGTYGIKNFEAQDSETLDLIIEMNRFRWQIQLAPDGVSLHPFPGERLSVDGSDLFVRPVFAKTATTSDGKSMPDGLPLLHRFIDLEFIRTGHLPEDAVRFRDSVGRVRLHRGASMHELMSRGSENSVDDWLFPDGRNVFSVLRNWRDRAENRYRYGRVMTGLKAIFPDLVGDVDFEIGSNAVSLRYYRPNDSNPIPIRFGPQGLLAALLHLTAMAGMHGKDLLAIDEFENSLHPFALRQLIELMRDWCDEFDTTICLATHSPVVIDEFNDDRERLFVLEPGRQTQPVPVTELAESDWLRQFSLGRLYSHGDIGSPRALEPDRNGTPIPA